MTIQGSDVSYHVTDWRRQFKASQTGFFKRLAYSTARPVLNLEARSRLSSAMLTAHAPKAVLREFGFPVESRRRWALTHVDVRNAVVLVQGTGSGWDVLTWASHRPRRIIATDLFAFDAWDEIARHCADKWQVECEFRQAPLEDHAFLASQSVDICASDAVLEHCRDLGAVLAESRRVLKPGGRLYASYGPLWFCGGGDHYSGRGGSENLYNHLLLSPTDYRAYLDRSCQSAEDLQNGYRYIELDLFSKLTTAEYLRLFRSAGFNVDELMIELSSAALRFRKSFPDHFQRVLAETRGRCSADDLVIKGNFVKLTKA